MAIPNMNTLTTTVVSRKKSKGLKLPYCLVLAVLVWLGVVFVTHSTLISTASLQFFAPASAALELCNQVKSSTRRAYCFSDLSATNDERVARKFASMILAAEAQKGAWQFHDAAIACALAVDIPSCVHDVLLTQNVSVAIAFPKKPLPFRNKLGTVIMEEVHHDFTEEDAQRACEGVQNKVEQIYCEKHFTRLDDEDTAKHYIHLSMDQANMKANRHENLENKRPHHNNTLEDAQILCASAPFRYYEPCLQQVQLLPNDHVAFHFVQLFKMQADASPSQELTEKLCNHVPPQRRHACIQRLTNLQGPEAAAAHYIRFFFFDEMANLQPRKPLTLAQAKQICEGTTSTEQSHFVLECQRDVLTMNSPAAAQIYAELLLKQTGGKSS